MRHRLRWTLPRGGRDLLWQVGIWIGFALAYQIARGLADRSPAEAMTNGRLVIDAERAVHSFVERDIQHAVTATGGLAVDAVNWTYWLSQFSVLALALAWIYLFRNDAYARVRNWILATNLLGLIGYVLMPTAPPRFFPEEGFVDTLAVSGGLNHGSGIIQIASNQYAAMPSLHSADALVIGFAMAALVRSRWAKLAWTLWPSWVWFSTMATGNHFWLDIAAGVGVAMLARTMLAWVESRRPTVSTAVSAPRRW